MGGPMTVCGRHEEMSGFALTGQDCYLHWYQKGPWGIVAQRSCFFFMVQARFTVLLLFFLIVKVKGKKTKSYIWCWVFHKILASLLMHVFHSDISKKMVDYILKEKNAVFLELISRQLKDTLKATYNLICHTDKCREYFCCFSEG